MQLCRDAVPTLPMAPRSARSADPTSRQALPPILDTQYSILSLHLLWSTEPLGLRASNAALSPPSKLPQPRLEAQYREERVSGVDFAAAIGFEKFERAFAGEESGGIKAARAREFAEAFAIDSVQKLAQREAEAGLGSRQDFVG